MDTNIQELIDKCRDLETSATKKAYLHKIVSILFSIMIIGSGLSIGVISSTDSSPTRYWITTALGFFITGLKAFSSLFSFDHRAIANKQISIKMRQFIRALRKTKNATPEEVQNLIDRLYKEFDALDLNYFANGYLTRVVSHRMPSTSSVLAIV